MHVEDLWEIDWKLIKQLDLSLSEKNKESYV